VSSHPPLLPAAAGGKRRSGTGQSHLNFGGDRIEIKKLETMGWMKSKRMIWQLFLPQWKILG